MRACVIVAGMTRAQIIEILRRHRHELNQLGVEGLALFGSAARDETDSESDIDLAATFDESVVKSLLDVGGVAATIERYLGTDNFDLADERQLRSHVKNAFQREHVRIF